MLISIARPVHHALLALLLLAPFAHAELQPVDEQALAKVSGQGGIAMEFELRANADASGNAIGTGCGAASPNYSDGVAEDCRLALNFNNRPDEWVVLKDFYGVLRFPTVYLDAACTSGTLTAGVCTGGATTTNYDDMSRFNDQSGGCLLTGSGSGCVAGDANNRSTLQFSIPGSAATFENDVYFGLNVGGVAVEYGATGYSNDSNGSFLGVRMRDASTGNLARFDLDGRLKLFGF